MCTDQGISAYMYAVGVSITKGELAVPQEYIRLQLDLSNVMFKVEILE